MRNDSFRKNVTNLQKKHLRETKKIKDSIKKKKDEISRLRKKVHKDSSASLTNLLDQSTKQLYSQYMELSDKEQEAIKVISQQKRLHLCAIIADIKPVVEEEVKMFRKGELMSGILIVIDKIISDDFNYPHQKKPNTFNNLGIIEEDDTIVGTPIQSRKGSVMGSRAGSIISLASITDTSSCHNKENIMGKGNRAKKLYQGQSFYSEVDYLLSTDQKHKPLQDASEMQNRPKGHRASTFSTVKRAHSPFRKLLHPDRTKEKEVYKPPEGPRPSRPPLPPRSPYVEDESLHNLQHKLQDISTIGYKNPGVSQHQHRSLPPLPPRSAYVEDDPIQELQDKLVCLDNSSSPPPEDPYQYYPTVTAANTGTVLSCRKRYRPKYK